MIAFVGSIHATQASDINNYKLRTNAEHILRNTRCKEIFYSWTTIHCGFLIYFLLFLFLRCCDTEKKEAIIEELHF